MTLRDLSEKDVIQLKTGENLGRIDDLAFEDGQITQVVLRGRARMFGLLGRDDDLLIPWAAVKTIGTDVIMVDADVPPPHEYNILIGWMYNNCKIFLTGVNIL